MKRIATILSAAMMFSVATSAAGFSPLEALSAFGGLVVLTMVMPGTANAGIFSAETIAIGPIADELKRYIKVADGLPAKWFYHPNVTLRQYAKKITKVQGAYQVPFSVMSAVVQGFKAEWNALGKTTFLGKEINNYHLKINLPINVTEILSFYKADVMYNENLKLEDRAIAKYIINNVGERVTHDMELLSIDGEYDAALMNTEFGYSMKGLYRVLQEFVTSTIAGTTDHPVFIIPANDELTTADPSAIIDEVDHFERSLPRRFRSRIKELFIERFYYDEFKAAKRLLHGGETNVTTDEFTMTYGGRKLVPLDSDKMGSMMFATIKDNLLDLVDVNDVPTIHDIQVQDYDIKVFGEGRGGFNVGINQCTFIRSEATSTLGLHNATQNKLFYDLSDTSGSGSGS